MWVFYSLILYTKVKILILRNSWGFSVSVIIFLLVTTASHFHLIPLLSNDKHLQICSYI